jgi:ubiquitin carboxyl-terminal hydrolase 7
VRACMALEEVEHFVCICIDITPDSAATASPVIQAEQQEKERKRKEKQEAHLYTVIRVARDADFAEQIGSTRHFDLVDHAKVRSPASSRGCWQQAGASKL